MARVHYERADGVGWIDVDDGKANVVSPSMQIDVHEALDRADHDGVVVVVRGRPGVFSAGFDLGVLRDGDPAAAVDMVLGGFGLARRLLDRPRPVVMACTGHAVAMGLFLLLSGDHRIGTTQPAELLANEIALGLTLPRSAEVILRHRIAPAAVERLVLSALPVDPADAVAVGVLDETVDDLDGLHERADEVARALGALDTDARRATKARLRAPLISALDAALALDRAELERQLPASSRPPR